MKLHQERGTVERGGIQAEREFTIKTTAKAFDILSSGLYSDNIQAIVRELSCNAYDSHVEAGKSDVPFDIHLPSKMEPYFEIKDYGIGLSEEDTMELYTTYFESTKTDSNDYIGALGLGSKSPFSYATAFSVVSRWNGKRLMFAVFLNDDGIPTIAKQGEIDTDETNGLEVRMTVKSDDFWSFRNRTESVLMYFPTKPKVDGQSNFHFDEHPSTRFEGDGWYISEKGWNQQNFVAVQGNVPYRVSVAKLTEHMEEGEDAFFDIAHVTAFFDIGDLEVAASREEIRYNDRTIKALVEKARLIRSELTGIVEEKTKELKTKSFWEACIELDKLSRTLFGKDHFIRKFIDVDVIQNPILKRYIETSGSVFLTRDDYRWYEIISYVEPKYGTNSGRLTRQNIGSQINPSTQIGIVEMDMKVGGVSRASAWLNEHPNFTRLIAIKPFKEDQLCDGQKDTKITAKGELKKIRRELGNPKILKVSELPITRPIRTYARTTGSMFTFDGAKPSTRRWGGSTEKPQWLKEDLDAEVLEAGGLYFVMRHSTHIMAPTLDGKEIHLQWTAKGVKKNFQGIVDVMNKHNGTSYEVKDIKGISALHAKKVKGDPNWINIFMASREIVPHYQNAICHQIRLRETPETLGITALVEDDTFLSHVKGLDETSQFRKAVLPMFEGHEAHSGLNGCASFLRKVDSQWGAGLFTDVDGDVYFKDDSFTVYPMLTFIGEITVSRKGSYHTPTDLNVLFDYIKMCDEKVVPETK